MADTAPHDVPNRGPILLAVNWFFAASCLLAMGMRVYVRVFMIKKFSLDDWVMGFATITFVLYCSCSIAGVYHGTGRHFADLEPDEIKQAMRFWWFCYLTYSLTMIASKISIGVFMLRIVTRRLHAWIVYTAMSLTVLSGLIFFFVTMFQCSPINYFWDRTVPGKCINAEIIIALAFLYSSFSVISDFTFAMLPIWLVMHLHMTRRNKMAVIPLLAMGCVASAAVAARFPYLPRLRNFDFLWETLDIAVWSTVEQGLAITAGSLATLRPLLRLCMYKLGRGSRPTGYGPSAYPSGFATGASRMKSASSGPDSENLGGVGGSGGGSRSATNNSLPLSPLSPQSKSGSVSSGRWAVGNKKVKVDVTVTVEREPKQPDQKKPGQTGKNQQQRQQQQQEINSSGDAYEWEIHSTKGGRSPLGASDGVIQLNEKPLPLASSPPLVQRPPPSLLKRVYGNAHGGSQLGGNHSTFFENESEEELRRAGDLEPGIRRSKDSGGR